MSSILKVCGVVIVASLVATVVAEPPPPATPADPAPLLKSLGLKPTDPALIERGARLTLLERMNAAYDKLDGLEVTMTALTADRMLPAPVDAISAADLLKNAPTPQQAGIAKWWMNDARSFRIDLYLIKDQPRIPADAKPDWQIVGTQLEAVAATPTQVGTLQPVPPYGQRVALDLLPESWLDSGLLGPLPYSLLDGRLSERNWWNRVISSGQYDGVFPAADGTPCHRITKINMRPARLGPPSVASVLRLYVEPTSWHVVQFDHIVPLHDNNWKCVGVGSLSSRYRYDSDQPLPAEMFDPEAFRAQALNERTSVKREN